MQLISRMPPPISFSELKRRDQEKAERVSSGQQLYATIKRSRKYFRQNDYAKNNPEKWGWPFRVRIEHLFDDYCVLGGPGTNYRLADVNLYVIEGGREIRIK